MNASFDGTQTTCYRDDDREEAPRRNNIERLDNIDTEIKGIKKQLHEITAQQAEMDKKMQEMLQVIRQILPLLER